MITLRPGWHRLRRILGRPVADIAARAVERIELWPAEERAFPPAILIPGMAERITGTEFAGLDDTLAALAGGRPALVPPTMAWRLRHVDLIDGVLYAAGGERHLRPRTRRALPFARRPVPDPGGVLTESWSGNRWFGNWLMDNCVAYPLHAGLGEPLTTAPPGTGHVPRYEEVLGIRARRVTAARFDTLTLVDDLPQNGGKFARAAAMRARLLAGRDPAPLPGVWLWRGQTGDRRVMMNEDDIAGRLARDHGFRVLEPPRMTVDALIDACAGAQVVAGVEGSHLVHGIAVAPPGAAVLTIHPPDRVTTALKVFTDRLGQHFACVVAAGNQHAFRADWGDVARTLDLVP